MNLISVHI